MNVRTRIKFCGMTSAAEIALATRAGADAVGVIVAPQSPRCVSDRELEALAAATPPFVARIGVVTSAAGDHPRMLREFGYTLQFSGDDSADACERAAAGRPYLKALHVSAGGAAEAADGPLEVPPGYDHALWLLDSRVGERLGGTGVAFSWPRATALARSRRVVVSGGLTPENVGACVRALRPYAVDVRSGVESDGRKDEKKMHAFVRAVREADAEA